MATSHHAPPYPLYNSQSYPVNGQTPSASANTDHPPYTLSNSLLQDDKNLFENCDRFLRGEIDQKEFQARYCTRLLFIWEWVFKFCFWNFRSALQTWYQILEKENVWLWVDGDEAKGPERRLIEGWHSLKGSTDLHSSCKLSRFELQHAVYILKTRLQPAHSSSLTENAPGLGRLTHQRSLKPGEALTPWRQRLVQCPDPILRYAVIILKIANSDPIQALDSARRIKGRTAQSVFPNLQLQFRFGCRYETCTSWQVYDSQLKILGHTCNSYADDTRRYRQCKCLIIKRPDVLGPNPNVSKRIDECKNAQCQRCLENGPLLISDTTWDSEAPRMQDNNKSAPIVPRNCLRFLWYLWWRRWWWSSDDAALRDPNRWLDWLASLAIHATCRPASRNKRAVCSVVACLLSPQMEDWATAHRPAFNSYMGISHFEQERNVDFTDPYDWMYIPTLGDWEAAEASLRSAELGIEPCQESPNIHGTLGILICWISERSVETPFPEIYRCKHTSDHVPPWLVDVLTKHQDNAFRSLIKSKILDGRPGCCPLLRNLDQALDLCLASATVMVSQDDITAEMVWGCQCDKSTPTDLIRHFSNYLVHNKMWNKNEIRASWEGLASMAKQQTLNLTTSFREFKREISRRKRHHIGNWRLKSDSESSEEEREESTPPVPPQKLGQTGFDSAANQQNETASRNQTSAQKRSKSHQIEAIRTYLLDCLSRIESETSQIPSLIPRGKQKVSLPWKTLTQILKERGYEIENWPSDSDVPLPGSGSELCDDNKGIHGLNAKHLRALYDATQDKERPLRFKKVRDMIPVTICMEEAVRRQGTIRRREMSDEGEAGPSKRSRVDMNNAGPSWAIN